MSKRYRRTTVFTNERAHPDRRYEVAIVWTDGTRSVIHYESNSKRAQGAEELLRAACRTDWVATQILRATGVDGDIVDLRAGQRVTR